VRGVFGLFGQIFTLVVVGLLCPFTLTPRLSPMRRIEAIISALYAEISLAHAENTGHNIRVLCGD
jgi:hypothetical protein